MFDKKKINIGIDDFKSVQIYNPWSILNYLENILIG
jgi:hypothetical protein